VGDGSDKWTPPGSDTGRGVALSAAAARREGARVGCWAALLGPKPGTGPRREEKGEGGVSRLRGKKRMGRARDREGERKTFSIF